MVRQVVARTVGQLPLTSASGQVNGRTTPPPARPIIDANAIRQLPAHSTHTVPSGSLITPLAREAALERGIQLEIQSPKQEVRSPIPDHRPLTTDNRTVALGADHGGYQLKEQLKEMLAKAGYTVIDCGAHSSEAVDYPDYAYAVAQLVANGRAWRGIMIDGAGIGSCMAANKVPGVRAAMCYDQATAVNSREHNDANVLTLGAGLIGPALANQIVTTWLNTEFGGGRHARRVDKIDAIGKRFIHNP
ncbi:MAG: ribose 5-phosphate isomerase B [Chloroflexi bacterium]|nr:ribose 5-phosphate isomerase B [Ardenticatenaceae bacterium]MBL1128864.1 ribose 5-phosphate isomerase B [Chloroflexota bacterium]NOG34941.1 ribose 5-phosphate isomerase B [Chloroflexota bacterium]